MDFAQQYLEGVELLPFEIQRNLVLMQDLDSRAQNILRNADEVADKYISNMKSYSTEKKAKYMKHMESQFDKAREYGDDKVQLSIQTYELVDKQIRNLDTVLAHYDAKIKNKTMIAMEENLEEEKILEEEKNLEEEKPNYGHTNDRKTNKKKSKNMKCETVTKTSKKKPFKKGDVNMQNVGSSSNSSSDTSAVDVKKNKSGVANVDVQTNSFIGAVGSTFTTEAFNMPVDPNEPTFCLCNQVSFGEMIACDNPNCFIEWFHFECVNLTTKPKGKWFCSKCGTNNKKN